MGIWLGCSGWSYEEWVGPLYPDKATKKFSYYNHFFKAAEIDSTFYTYPKPGMILGLARNSSLDFVFTAKFPRLITHEAALEPTRQLGEDTKNFLDVMRPLGRARRLGALLLQLPPSFDFGRIDDLAQFLESLPTDLRYAVEFRHNSWIREETWSLLRKHGVAYTIVDEPLLPPEVQTTTDFAYVRWHGHGTNPWFNFRYSNEQLQEWIPKLREIEKRTKETYGMFNNHFHGYAPENCLKVMEMLGVATPEQEALRKKITEYIDGIHKIKQTKLRPPDASVKEGRQMASPSDLLAAMMDPARFKRAGGIARGEIILDEVTASVVRGHVRDYSIVIDMDARSIEHDCDDWAKGIGERRLCKHVGAFILALPSERAVEILYSLGLKGGNRLAFKAKGKLE